MSDVEYFEIDDYCDEIGNLDHDKTSEVRSAYVDYLVSKLKTASTFNDWHEQSYGKSVSKSVITSIMHEVEEEFCDEAGDFLLDLHRD